MESGIRTMSPAIPSPPLHRHSPSHPLTGLLLLLRRRRRPPRLRASSASGDAESVDVIGIGSRKDALIDFCLGSSLASSSRRLRFWTIHTRDSRKVQLLQRGHGADVVMKNVEFPLPLEACPPSVILVASAGHGLDHSTAAEILNAVKTAGGLTAVILLKPFSFEGWRRQEEVHDMVKQLRECSHFHIVVEADSLLKTEVETLAETLESVNNAAFLAISTISVLMSEKHLMFLNIQDEQMREIKPLEVVKILESHGEAKIGFGAGYNIKAAIIQAVFHCPFLSGSIKDINGLVIFTLASSCTLDLGDLLSVILTFRQVTGYAGEMIFSRIHEPELEPNLVVTTLLIAGCSESVVAPEQNILSRLSLQFPFIFSLIGGDSPVKDSKGHFPSQSSLDFSISSSLSDSGNMSTQDLVKGDSIFTPEEMETKKLGKKPSFKNKSSIVPSEFSQDLPCTQREEAISWNMGPGFNIAQLWAKERAAVMAPDKINNENIFIVPVGVKSSKTFADCSTYIDNILSETAEDTSGEVSHSPRHGSGDELTDACLNTLMDIYNTALTILKGRNVDESKRLGILSLRAASMLDAEREIQKGWTPMMEMQYKGGTYRGRSQGGLPEGKGHLTYMDGSFYDGTWRYGKRSGLGTFCYSNGDVFQGSWRDDLMHGKGWFYFHSGDRWFANFWKGKADGEGRFYSKNGSIFFGHFKNGWRHGRSLCIDADGSRWTEIWNDGVLVKRTELDSDSEDCG